MHYTLFSQAKRWVAPAYGTDDATELADAINAIRREWYSWYEQIQLFIDVEECFEVQQFCYDCNERSSYQGVTLPFGWESVSAMWFNDAPVQLFDRWRAWQNGIGSPRDCGLVKHDIADTFPTERDIRPSKPTRLVVRAMNPADIGKRFVVRGRSIMGAPVEHTFKLDVQPQMTTELFVSINQPGGVVKELTSGRVILAEECGRVLSIYCPAEQVPSYKRIRIEGIPTGCRYVNIRAARRYVELFDDWDVVESDNQKAWESMGRALRLNRKADRSGSDMASEAAYRAEAKAMLLGDKSRTENKSTVTELFTAVGAMPFHRRLSR